MANSVSNKGPPSKNVIYDSRNDANAGGKRAVDITGEVSVAERARLFGAQISRSTGPKATKPSTSPSVEEQPERTYRSRADSNYQRYRSGASQNYAYPSSYRPPNNFPPIPPQNYDRINREQPVFDDSQQYSTVTRSHPQQPPVPVYESVQYSSPNKSNYPQTSPGESYPTETESHYQSQPRQHASPPRNPNYFQPIQDPLEVLYKQQSPYEYSLPPIPTTANVDPTKNGLQSFDLGNLIGRIQQDYLNNVRPYVSSIQFIENEQNLGNVGLPTSSTNRKEYSNRPANDLYLRPGASYHYDVIDTSQFLPTYTRPMQDQHHGSTRRKRKHAHYRDRASSPINVATKPKTPTPPPNPPASAETEAEEDETANTKTEENKTTEAETSEEETEEEESAVAPPPPPPPAVAPTPNQRPGIALPGLANSTPTIAARTPAKEQTETESSDSEESESESDSDSDSDDDKKKKKNLKPPARAVQVTPQSTARGTPQSITRATPQSTPLMTKTVTNKANDPPESTTSVKSFDVQDSKKSSGIGGKFKSMTKVFRRKKS